MTEVNHNEIVIISRYSNWKAEHIDTALRETGIYPDRTKWQKFIKMFVVGTGAAFFVSGVIFFFAFNWHELHKFIKLALTEIIVVGAVIPILLFTTDKLLQNILLTAASVLTGAIFAVFGQVYQTGANAYDLFLIWTLSITIWVIVADFHALYLFYIVLVNTTICLFAAQTNADLNVYDVFNILAAVNSAVLVALKFLSENGKITVIQPWFEKIIALLSLAVLAVGTIVGIFSDIELGYFLLIFLMLAGFGAAIWYAVKNKRLFYIVSVATFVLFIMTALLTKAFDDIIPVLLADTLFVAGAFTLLVKFTVRLKQLGYE